MSFKGDKHMLNEVLNCEGGSVVRGRMSQHKYSGPWSGGKC